MLSNTVASHLIGITKNVPAKFPCLDMSNDEPFSNSNTLHQVVLNILPPMPGKTQFAPPEDTSASLNAADTKHVQEVLGTFLFYASRAINSTMRIALSTLASQQSEGTRTTMIAFLIKKTADTYFYLRN